MAYTFKNARYQAELQYFAGSVFEEYPTIDEARKGAVKLAKEYHSIVYISTLYGDYQLIGKVMGHTVGNHDVWFYESYTPSGTTKDLKKFNPKTGKLKR